MNPELQSELASWTVRALGSLAVGSRTPTVSGTGYSATAAISTVASVLQRVARQHPLCNLPRPVIVCIFSYMDNLDALTVSHTSHGVRAALLSVPELWSKVSILPAQLWPTPSPVYQDVLSNYLERSDPLPFDARLMLAGNGLQVSEQIALLAGNMHRMAALRLVCSDGDSEDGSPRHSWSSLLRPILGEPAPQLATLHIFYTCVSSAEEAFEPLVLRDIFCVAAPSLRRVKLSVVRNERHRTDTIASPVPHLYSLWACRHGTTQHFPFV